MEDTARRRGEVGTNPEKSEGEGPPGWRVAAGTRVEERKLLIRAGGGVSRSLSEARKDGWMDGEREESR